MIFDKNLLKELEAEQNISVGCGWEKVTEYNTEGNVEKRKKSWMDRFKTKDKEKEKDDKTNKNI